MNRTECGSIERNIKNLTRKEMNQGIAISTRGRGIAQSIQEAGVRMFINISSRVTPRTGNPDITDTVITLRKMSRSRSVGVPSQGIGIEMITATLMRRNTGGHISIGGGSITPVLKGSSRKTETRVNSLKVA